ncbi:MAG: DUF465 domain-containing protein [Candidatus Dadabacteria bacterium]|nr:DUF465 domain-containing protein [Candidatus Dadabacteria bacterium]NIS08262.1 DUF465 domain-containing protein [Candidatus Dadabacteria bacterium]NIY21747.1 DUF465 domain-containing protein [Candidatus Dadabacteria bacterium]
MADDNLVQKLLEEDEEFKNLFSEHRQLDEKVAILEIKENLSTAEELEIKQLKKLKLALKDKMQQKIKQHNK